MAEPVRRGNLFTLSSTHTRRQTFGREYLAAKGHQERLKVLNRHFPIEGIDITIDLQRDCSTRPTLIGLRTLDEGTCEIGIAEGRADLHQEQFLLFQTYLLIYLHKRKVVFTIPAIRASEDSSAQ
ncbi:MAG: hypothetical protein ABIE84_07355 [bacterium]